MRQNHMPRTDAIDWQISFQAGEEQITLDSLPPLDKEPEKKTTQPRMEQTALC